MKWRIDRSSLPAYLHVTIDGEVTATANLEMWDEILSSKRWKPGTSVLIDLSPAIPLGPKGQELAHYAADYLAKHRKEIGNAFIAVYNVPADFHKHAREIQRGLLTHDSDVIIQDFPDKASAVEWLKHLATFKKPNHKHRSASNST